MITLPCQHCQAPCELPPDDLPSMGVTWGSPLVCQACGRNTPVRWFGGPRAMDRYKLFRIRQGLVSDVYWLRDSRSMPA